MRCSPTPTRHCRECDARTTSAAASRISWHGRTFRALIDAEDGCIGARIGRIIEPLQQRLRTKKRSYRQDTLIHAARRWRDILPGFGRLSLDVDLQHGALLIHEWRASSGAFKFNHWGEDTRPEIDVGLVSITVEASRGRFRCTPRLGTSIAFHALARHFERCADRSHDVLKNDLLAIAKRHDEIVRTPSIEFSIPTAAAAGSDRRARYPCRCSARPSATSACDRF